MDRYEKTLVLLLRLSAVLLLTAIIPAVMPFAWMGEIHRQLGFEVREDWLSQRQPRAAAALERWARQAGVPYYDLTPALRKVPQSLFFLEDYHFTPAGNAVAAGEVAAFLRRLGVTDR